MFISFQKLLNVNYDTFSTSKGVTEVNESRLIYSYIYVYIMTPLNLGRIYFFIVRNTDLDYRLKFIF